VNTAIKLKIRNILINKCDHKQTLRKTEVISLNFRVKTSFSFHEFYKWPLQNVPAVAKFAIKFTRYKNSHPISEIFL